MDGLTKRRSMAAALYLGVDAGRELLEAVREHVVVTDLGRPVALVVLLVVPLPTREREEVSGRPASVSTSTAKPTHHAHEVVQLRRRLQAKVQDVAADDEGTFTHELRQVLLMPSRSQHESVAPLHCSN
jgi:hypothetical protein